MQLLTIVCTSLAAGIMATATPTSLPLCSMVDRPCKCPPGTTFKNLTTYGVIGAPARDVQDIMGSCEYLRSPASSPSSQPQSSISSSRVV